MNFISFFTFLSNRCDVCGTVDVLQCLAYIVRAGRAARAPTKARAGVDYRYAN